MSADASIHAVDLQRPMSPNNEPITRGLTDVLASDKERSESVPRRSGECHALYDVGLAKSIRQNQRM